MTKIIGKKFSQFGEFTIWISVQASRRFSDFLRNGFHDSLRKRMGVLVDIQLDGHVDLRCAIWG